MQMADGGGGGGYPRSLPSAGTEIQVNHTVLKDVADKLAKDLKELEGSGYGTLSSFQSAQPVLGGGELGRYPAAEGTGGQGGFAGTCRNAYEQIDSVYSAFIGAYGQFVESLKRAADVHAQTEQANRSTVDSVVAGGSSSGSSPHSQFYA